MIDGKKEEFEKALEHLNTEFSKLRTNRANPAILETLNVDYYGAVTPINQLANVSVPEARQLLVQPWDKNALQPIESAIRNSDLGLNPTNEGDRLRITLPELNEERRRELVKLASKMAEDTRVRIRNIREEIAKEIKQQEEAKTISEDERFKRMDDLQDMVKKCNDQIKENLEAKEKEIMTV